MKENKLIYRLLEGPASIGETLQDRAELAIVGFGPAGQAVAASYSKLPQRGVVAIDPDRSGSGHFTDLAIHGNSPRNEMAQVCALDGVVANIARDFARHKPDEVPDLSETADFLRSVREGLLKVFSESGEGLFLNVGVAKINFDSQDGERFAVVDTTDGRRIFANKVTFATGSKIVLEENLTALKHDVPIFDSLFASTNSGIAEIEAILEKTNKREIILVASSHSFITAKTLADKLGQKFSDLKITVLHKGAGIPLFFETEEAEQTVLQSLYGRDWQQYRGLICPATGRINRWDGVRAYARAALFSILKGEGYKNVTLQPYDGDLSKSDIQTRLKNAACVIQGFGWKRRAIPLLQNGDPVALSEEGDGRLVNLDSNFRLLDANGTPIDGAYGNGFGYGRDPLNIANNKSNNLALNKVVPVGLNVMGLGARKIINHITA